MKARRSTLREKSPVASNEVAKSKPIPKSRASQSGGRKVSQARSKSRSRKAINSKVRGRSRSRSRSKSRSRPRSKSKSPPKRKSRARSRSRPTRSPTRTSSRNKSKSRNQKSQIVLTNLVDISTEQKPFIESKENFVEDFSQKESKLKEIIRRSISREFSQEKINSYSLGTVATHPSVLTSLKEIDSKNDEIPKKDIQKQYSFLNKKPWLSITLKRWIATITATLIFPLAILGLHLTCNYNQCFIKKFSLPHDWEIYFCYKAAAILVAFISLQGVLSLLPIGKVVDGLPGVNGILQYRCNGLLCTFLTVGLVTALWRYGIQVTVVHDKIISLLISTIIFAYILGFILFLKGGKAPVPGLNPASIVENKFYQFFMGREVNPFFFKKINVKVMLIRSCLNGMLVLNGILALRAYEIKNELSYAIAANIVINALLVFDFFWFENYFPTTFGAMYEGAGSILVLKYLLYPFLPTLMTKFILLRGVELPLWGLLVTTVSFVVGYVIHRASSLEKAIFRMTPLNPALSHLEAISTNRGKKLLVSGWWGWVRHPNYLGFVILHWAWASASGYNSAFPFLVPFIITLLMMLKARRVDAFCRYRYQSYWEEYCSRVPYKIFPKVY